MIYFTAATKGVSKDRFLVYKRIVELLEEMGHKVIAEQVFNEAEDWQNMTDKKEIVKIQRQMSKWRKQSDMIVAEVSQACVAVGQEISTMLHLNKPVIALYQEGMERPCVLGDEGSDLLLLLSYTKSDLPKRLKEGIGYASERQDSRFNFFISSKIGNYLDWIAKKRKVPRAVYLRRLIETEMQENEEYGQNE